MTTGLLRTRPAKRARMIRIGMKTTGGIYVPPSFIRKPVRTSVNTADFALFIRKKCVRSLRFVRKVSGVKGPKSKVQSRAGKRDKALRNRKATGKEMRADAFNSFFSDPVRFEA